MATPTTGISLMDRVQLIAPTLQAHSDEGERERRLAPRSVAAMVDAGLFRMWTPRAFGGLELDPVTALRIVEEVSRFDSAAGWNLQLSISASLFLFWVAADGAEEVLSAKPDLIMGGTLFPPGRAVPVEGGYRLNGRWPFVSGCHDCSWFLGPAFIFDSDGAEPRRDANGQPIQLLVIYRAEEAEIVDTWHTIGMRGTGSHDVAARDVFVPARRTGLLVPVEKFGRFFDAPLYRMTIWPGVAALAAPALGIARAAIDALVSLGKEKTPQYTRAVLRERPVVQRQIGQAEALLGAARAYFHESLTEGWDGAAQGRTLTLQKKIKIQLATSYAIRGAADAIDVVHEAAGTTAIRQGRHFERYFRDAHVITQHAFASTARYESVGKVLLGLESDWPFFGL